LSGARREFEQAARLLPDSANVFYMLAITLDELGETEAARPAFEKSLALNPKDAAARSGYGEVLYKLNDKQGALREQLEANRLKPDDARYLIALGHAQENAGEVEAARKSFERAAELDSAPAVKATAYMRLGYLLAGLGETGKAVEALRRGVALDPDDEYANRKLRELEAADRRSQGVRPPGDDASAEDILRYLERFHRAVIDDGDSYPIPPKPEQIERMALTIENARKATNDADLKKQIETALRERMPFLREASKAFWGASESDKKESKPVLQPGGVGTGTGAGGGTGPPRP
jgi:tetratricopeptide (TPR) repeat protein